MVRTPSYDQNGIKKGAWSTEEDQILRSYILKYGHWNWRELPKFAGLKRCGKSCRLRWMNYLRPNLKHGNYTKEEEDLIIQLHQNNGNKWAIIASKLPGRTDNEIKNHWHTHLKKRVRPQSRLSTSSTNKSQLKPLRSEDSESERKLMNIQILESCPILSPQTITSNSSDEISTSTLSSTEISTVGFGFDDDGGWEEIINNSSELFAELSSISPLDYEIMNDDQVYTTSSTNAEYSVQETSTKMDTYEELQDDGFWSSFGDNNEVLFSPCVNYSDDDLILDYFRDQPSEHGGAVALES